MSKEKCELNKDGFYDWCNGMNKKLHPEANAKVKGLIQVNLFNFTTGKESCLGVVYKSDIHDKGLILNLCPWCGEGILNQGKLKQKKRNRRR